MNETRHMSLVGNTSDFQYVHNVCLYKYTKICAAIHAYKKTYNISIKLFGKKYICQIEILTLQLRDQRANKLKTAIEILLKTCKICEAVEKKIKSFDNFVHKFKCLLMKMSQRIFDFNTLKVQRVFSYYNSK